MNDKVDNEAVVAGPAASVTTFGLTRYVHAIYFAGLVMVGWLLAMVLETLWTSLNMNIAAVPAPNRAIVFAVSAAVAIGLCVYLWRHPKVNPLVREIVTELSKVSWPTRKELYASTVVVIILSVIASIVLGLFDGFWSWFTDKIFSIRA